MTQRKIALITGGSRGLGRSMAQHLARQGCDVVLTYKTNRAEADAALAELGALGAKALAFPLDAGEVRGFAAFAASLRAELPRVFGRDKLDFLVNNAGFGLHKAFAETAEAEFDALFGVHLKGVYFLTQQLLPLIADGGRILNVSSGLTRFSYPGYSAYAAMKGGVEVLTRYLAKELAPRGIRVNVIAPGAIATDFNGGAVRDTPALNQAIASQTALGRVGEADDIGAMVALLLAPGSDFVNGQRIEVSGGIHL
jgi:NAD(P)-dependent dehydrogenase (short-subunit alcohol dehydrogenase family)